MKFKFNLDKKNYNEFLSIIQSRYDSVYLILYSLIYFYITFYIMKINFKSLLIYYVVSIIVLYLIISLVKKVFRIITIKKNKSFLGNYDVKIDENNIKQSINNIEIFDIKKENIKKIIYRKYGIMLKINNKYYIYFIKKIIKNSDYIKLNNYLKKNY